MMANISRKIEERVHFEQIFKNICPATVTTMHCLVRYARRPENFRYIKGLDRWGPVGVVNLPPACGTMHLRHFHLHFKLIQIMFNKLKHLQEEAYFPHREINLSRPKNLSSTDFGSLSSKHPIVSFRLGPYLKGECMNLKAKPHKQSLVVED